VRTWFLGVLIACGGQTTAPSDGGTSDSPTPSFDTTFAVNRIYLGEVDRTTNAPSTTAWKSYGLNIDGLLTTGTSTDVCTLAAGASKAEQIDGNNGIDNVWGSTLLPIFQSAASLQTPSASATDAMVQGRTTLLVRVAGMTDDPSQTASGLKVRVVAGGTYPGTPSFDPTTSWPVLSGATATDFDATITNGVLATSPGAPLVVTIPIGGAVVSLTIHHPIILFTHTGRTNITNGTIAGVLDTNEFIAEFDAIAGYFSTSLCGSAKDGVDQECRKASEILVDGTNHAGTPCTGLSIGIGFDAVLVGEPGAPAAIDGPPDPCP